VDVSGEYFRIEGAPAYHDHNWGRFRWGGSYAWQWGVALPEDDSGYGLVFDRVVNTSSRQIIVQGTMLIQGGSHLRTFIDPEVSCAWDEPRSRSTYRIPSITRIASPGDGIEVPTVCRVSSQRKRDRVDLGLWPRDAMEIGIPSDIDSEPPMILSEAFGDGQVQGSISGIPFKNRVLGVFEQIAGGATG
jgi:hypothetical protein